jgi:hypothetical protein
MLIGISGKIGAGKDTVGNILCYLNSKSYKEGLPFINVNGYYTQPYQIKKFADKLKEIVCLLIGCTREQLEDREFKEKELGEEWWYWKDVEEEGVLIPYNQSTGTRDCKLVKLTPRLLLQLLGTEAGRQIIHPNIWVNALFADYRAIGDILLDGEVRKVREEDLIYPNWIITDVRFPNEAKAIKERGGIVIRVIRPLRYEDDTIRAAAMAMSTNATTHESETALDNYQDWDVKILNNGSIEGLIEKVSETLKDMKVL